MIQYSYRGLAAFLFAALLAACGGKTNPAETPPVTETEHHDEETNEVELSTAQFKVAGIELGAVSLRPLSGTIQANGVLDVPPQQMVSIHAPMGGFIQKINVLQGSLVKRGQVLATISNPEFVQIQQDYLETKHQLELARTEYERQQELAKENVNAQKTLQQAKANFNGLDARSKGMAEKLRLLGLGMGTLEGGNIRSTVNLYSPINGYVTEVNTNAGKSFGPTDMLFEVVDLRGMHVELKVFENDLPRLRTGQRVRYQLANETKERVAKVLLIGREIEADRTVRVHCLPQGEPGANILPGLALRASIETGAAETTALPDEAVVNFQGKRFIFVQESGDEHGHEAADKEAHEHVGEEAHKAEEAHASAEAGAQHFTMVEVQVGVAEGGYTEVMLPQGFDRKTAVVVLKGAYSLLAKLKNSEEEGGH